MYLLDTQTPYIKHQAFTDSTDVFSIKYIQYTDHIPFVNGNLVQFVHSGHRYWMRTYAFHRNKMIHTRVA